MKFITIAAAMAFLLSGATGYAQQQLPGSAAAHQYIGDPLNQEPTYDQLRRNPGLATRDRGPKASFTSAMELYAEISATNPNFKKVYALLTHFANDGYQWWQVAELGFDSLMVRNRLSG
jgi:hypothetical protein